MNEELDLEELLEMESQLSLKGWQSKTNISKEEYMQNSLELCNEYFDEYKSKMKILSKYKTHEHFEKYLIKHEDKLDSLLTTYGQTEFGGYLSAIDARIGIKKDRLDIFESVFFKIKEEETDMYFTLPKVMYEQYDTFFAEETRKEIENGSMFS